MYQKYHYLLIGRGRVATHFKHYLSLLHLPFAIWHRDEPLATLYNQMERSTRILLLISDNAIESFIEKHLSNTQIVPIHFSGRLTTQQAWGAHPLMTFSNSLYDLKQYQAIPFILDHDAPAFTELFPGLSNPHVRLQKSMKAKYHALCVLSGNFSCLLWQKLFASFENEFGLEPSIAYPYLYQQMKNLSEDYKSALTGPLVRGDLKTIEQNLKALETDPFQEVYKSFVTCFKKIKDAEISSHEYF